MAVEAISHEAVAVELGGGLVLIAALAGLVRDDALFQGGQPLPPMRRILRKASLAVVVQPVRVGLVAVEIVGGLQLPTPPAGPHPLRQPKRTQNCQSYLNRKGWG